MAGRRSSSSEHQPNRPGGRLAHGREGIAVDRRIVEGRHRPRADQRCRQNPANSLDQRHGFAVDGRPDALAQSVECCSNRDVAAAEIETVEG
jgi:hypothetical protein